HCAASSIAPWGPRPCCVAICGSTAWAESSCHSSGLKQSTCSSRALDWHKEGYREAKSQNRNHDHDCHHRAAGDYLSVGGNGPVTGSLSRQSERPTDLPERGNHRLAHHRPDLCRAGLFALAAVCRGQWL